MTVPLRYKQTAPSGVVSRTHFCLWSKSLKLDHPFARHLCHAPWPGPTPDVRSNLCQAEARYEFGLHSRECWASCEASSTIDKSTSTRCTRQPAQLTLWLRSAPQNVPVAGPIFAIESQIRISCWPGGAKLARSLRSIDHIARGPRNQTRVAQPNDKRHLQATYRPRCLSKR